MQVELILTFEVKTCSQTFLYLSEEYLESEEKLMKKIMEGLSAYRIKRLLSISGCYSGNNENYDSKSRETKWFYSRHGKWQFNRFCTIEDYHNYLININ